jgi:hypothetical protein
MSVITKIEYLKNIHIKNECIDDYFQGYKITTTDDLIEETPEKLTTIFPRDHTKIFNFFVLISNTQSCCEKFDVSLFLETYLIGSIIEKISFGNTNKINDDSSDSDDEYVKENQCVIDVYTNNGLCKFIISNEHNGYYSHTAYLSFNNYIYTEDL